MSVRTPSKYSLLYRGPKEMIKEIIRLGLYEKFDRNSWMLNMTYAFDPLFEKMVGRKIIPKTEAEQIEYLQCFIDKHMRRLKRDDKCHDILKGRGRKSSSSQKTVVKSPQRQSEKTRKVTSPRNGGIKTRLEKMSRYTKRTKRT